MQQYLDIFDDRRGDVCVSQISSNETYPFLLDVHYAKRIPSITFAYGLFVDGVLEGVVTYGTPSSATLRAGICGKENSSNVLELNRLCLLENKRNHASILVGKSLRMLPSGKIIVSFADTEQGHVGYVYQATNFIYCGLSEKRTDWKVKGLEHLHGQTIADEFRGVKNRAEAMRQKYGDRFYLKDRSRKHRYVFFTGSKSQKKRLKSQLRYETKSYPKENKTA